MLLLRLLFSVSFLVLSVSSVNAQFYGLFTKQFKQDKALRVDFSLSNNHKKLVCKIDNLYLLDNFYGSTFDLVDTTFPGNYRILLSKKNGDVIYARGFSSLYDEWKLLKPTRNKKMKFQHSINLPFPKGLFYVTLQKRNNKGKFITLLDQKFTNKKQVNQAPPSKLPASFLSIMADGNERIDLVIVADNYTQDSMLRFVQDVNNIVTELFSVEPLASYKNYFNIILVENARKENQSTLVSTEFMGVKRYAAVPSFWKLENMLTGIPHEYVVILYDTTAYMGGALYNQYCITSSSNPKSVEILRHELGHLIFGLADEYVDIHSPFKDYYNNNKEPWEPNITKHTDTIKWSYINDDLVDSTIVSSVEDTVKYYEGAGYQPKGIYRPDVNCIMREVDYPNFCPVCERHMRAVLNNMLGLNLDE